MSSPLNLKTAVTFTASLDGLAKAITFCVCIVILIPFLTILVKYQQSHQPLVLLPPAAVALTLGILALYRPKGYSLSAAGLAVLRPACEVRYPLHRIRSVTPVTAKELGFGLRTFGVGGFLGYWGKFRYQHIGQATLFVTDRSKMILLTLDDDRHIIVSPDDTEGFVAAFNELKR